MNSGGMTQRITMGSPLFKARAAGVFWLMTILMGTVALVASGRLGVTANLIAGLCYIAATLLVYELLRPVNKSLSLLAASFSLMGCASGLLSSLFHLPRLGFVFFGFHLLLLGYLIFRSTFLPRFVGALMAFGGLGWLTLGLTSLLAPAIARSLSPYILFPGILGEASLTLWLLVKGVDVPRWEEKASVMRNGRA